MKSVNAYEYFSIYNAELDDFRGVLIESYPDDFSLELDALTCLGSDGWDLCATLLTQNSGDHIMIFKRVAYIINKSEEGDFSVDPGDIYKNSLRFYQNILSDTRRKKKEFVTGFYDKVRKEREK